MALVSMPDPQSIVPVRSGGTGITSYTIGDTLYASGTTALSKLAIGAATTVMTSTGAAPQWSTSLALTGTVASKQAAAAGISLDHNAATGNFTLRLSPANLATANRRWTFPDRDDTVAGLGAQTFTGAQTMSSTLTLDTSSNGLTISKTTGTTLTVSSTTDASSSTAAAIVGSGGLAIAKGAHFGTFLNVGTTISAGGNITITKSADVVFTMESTVAQYVYFKLKNTLREWHFANSGADGSFYIYDATATTTRLTMSSAGALTLPTTTGTTLTVSSTNAAAISCAGGVSATLFTPATGTITASTPALNATQTWNNVATTFTALKLNVTDTTSASASLLLDLQVGGSSKLSIQKDGSALTSGSILSKSATAGAGYATGAGGAATQITSRTTGVTLNTVCGAITLVSAAGSASYQSFTVTNSAVAATDTVIVNQKSGTDKNIILVTNVAAGSFQITFATTGGTTVEQPVFNFAVIKAVAA